MTHTKGCCEKCAAVQMSPMTKNGKGIRVCGNTWCLCHLSAASLPDQTEYGFWEEFEKKIRHESRAILYTDTVGGKQTLRDNLWSISTSEIYEIRKYISTTIQEERRKAVEEEKETMYWLLKGMERLTRDLESTLYNRDIERIIKVLSLTPSNDKSV